jgi:NADPH:quinone reductase-like Zn-dependent oxidoreductase
VKAVVFHEFGSPGVLHVEEVPTPVPGPGEVLLKVHAVSVNRTLDLAVRSGQYAHRPELPHILGADPCGIVSAIGPEVTARNVGDRVVCRSFIGTQPNGQPIVLGVHTWGGYAEFAKVPADATHRIPDELDFRTAVVVARHAPLAFTQLRDRAKVKPGEWVLIMGAAGGIGSIAIQAAKLLGAHVIAAAGSDSRVEVATQLGADAGVNYRTQDLGVEVGRITDGVGVNVVLENIGDPELFPQAVSALARGGRLVTAGGHGGGVVPLDVKHLYLNRITIIGDGHSTPDNFELALRVAAEGKLKALIAQVLPLSETAHAHELAEARAEIGKILIDPTIAISEVTDRRIDQ